MNALHTEPHQESYEGVLKVGIKENQELIMENILSFRGKVNQQQMQEEMIKTGQVFKDLGVKKMALLR